MSVDKSSELKVGIVEKELKEQAINVKYPEVDDFPELPIRQELNRLIKDTVEGLMRQQGYGKESLAKMWGSYLVGLNDKGILSIKFENYSHIAQTAHGLTVLRSLTVDLLTGQTYQLKDLFSSDSAYRLKICHFLEEESSKRQLPLAADLQGLDLEQAYYLTTGGLVIYRQAYEYTPFAGGLPEFFIPYPYLADLVEPGGLLARLISRQS